MLIRLSTGAIYDRLPTLKVGSIGVPVNNTAGDFTCARLKVGDGAFGTGVDFSVTGDGALSGFLRVGSETAPTNTTAGDITAARLHVGTDGALGASAIAVFIGGRVGLNTDSPTYPLHLAGTVTETIGIANSATMTSVNAQGMASFPTMVPDTTGGNALGFNCALFLGPTSGINIVAAYGAVAQAITNNTLGTIASMYGLFASLSYNTLKPTNAYGVAIPNIGSAGITTARGLSIAVPTGSTNNYGLEFTGATADVNATIGSNVSIPCIVDGVPRKLYLT